MDDEKEEQNTNDIGDPLNEAIINDLLKNIAHLSECINDSDEPSNNFDPQVLVNLIEQYLSPFIIIGYNIEGNCTYLTNVSTQRDHDAVSLALGRFMTTGGMNNGEFFGGDDDDDYDYGEVIDDP